MFSKTAQYYDIIYSFKDYQLESNTIADIISREKRSAGNRLLDVACGTGLHMHYLGEHYEVEGFDLDEELLAYARQRIPGAKFHHGDMTDFDLGSGFDVVTCLFSAIGYVKTTDNLARAIECMARHLVRGGILIVEPWLTPDIWQPGAVHAKFIDEPELKIARVNTSYVDGSLSYFDMHYLIGTPEGTEHFVERHELGLFTVEEMITAFEMAGLNVTHEKDGLMGRGLYIGRR
ncbi:MAG: class I SAM-dependent methyltransferase [Candidatus Promineifilaceae bacterium]